MSFEPSRIVADDLWAAGDPRQWSVGSRFAGPPAVVEHPGRELASCRARVTVEAVRERSRISPRANSQPLDGPMADKAIADILDAVEAREILKVLRLFRQVRRELPQPRARLNSVWFEPDFRVTVAGATERQARVFVSSMRKPRLAKEIPVLALDGTGSIDLNRKIFGDRMTLSPSPCHATPKSGRSPARRSAASRSPAPIAGAIRSARRRSHEAARLRRQVLDLLKMLPGKVLLVTYKAAEEVLQPTLPPHVAVAHFGALRGLNAYEHREIAVVMGREQPSAQTIEALTRPFCATDPEPFIPIGEYAPQSRGRRMRNGGPNVVEVQVHPDTRCQTSLEQLREAEIAQAIDRVRPVFNRRRIIVLTNIALDLTVDHALTWRELRPGKFAYAFARHGVLPLSAGDLCRGFPDLWSSENTAKSDLSRSVKTGCNSPIIYLLGVCTLFWQPPLQATYRRKGQRGPLAGALVRADLPDPRAVLQSLVGELVEFHVARPSEPPADVRRPEPAQALPPLPPLAAALSAEAHLLATLSPDERPSDMLGMAGAFRLMALKDAARTRKMAA